MYGINGQPIIDLDDHIDHKGFTELVPEIWEGLARSEATAGSFGPGVYEKNRAQDLYWVEAGTYMNRAPFTPRPEAFEVMKATQGMTINQKRLYIKLRYGLYNSGQSIYLRQPQNARYEDLNVEALNNWTGNEKYFPGLMRWIENLPFSEIGRILFFVNEHLCPIAEHSDMHASKDSRAYIANLPHTHEFIWIKPDIPGSKAFYVLDEATGQRHYVKGNSCWFNSFDVHGGDASPVMTWSLRIDGKFTDAFRKQLNVVPNSV